MGDKLRQLRQGPTILAPEQMHRPRLRSPRLQHAHQAAAGQRIGQQYLRLHQQPGPGDRRLAQRIAIVTAQNRIALPAHFPLHARQPPLVAGGPDRMGQAEMIGEIFRPPGRSVTRQISRRGADHHPIRRQVASHQILLMDLADTDRQIEPLIHQIDHPVSQIQFHPDRRPGLQEGGGQGRDHAGAERGGSAHPQGAGRRQPQPLDRAFGDGDLLHHPFRFVKIDSPGVGEALASGVTLQQTRRQLAFQLGDIFPDHHRRQPQARRRPGKAAALHHGNKRLHPSQLIHIANLWLVMF